VYEEMKIRGCAVEFRVRKFDVRGQISNVYCDNAVDVDSDESSG
jgi:hypothetical protein